MDNSNKLTPTVNAFTGGEGGSQAHDVDPKSTFADMRGMGIYHGPALQNLIGSKVSAAQEKSVMTFAMAPYAIEQQDEYVMHPTTLDSIFQTCYFSLPPKAREGGMLVPRSISTMGMYLVCSWKTGTTSRPQVEVVYPTAQDNSPWTHLQRGRIPKGRRGWR